MKKIRFYNIDSKKGSITFKVESKEEYEESIDIYFKFDRRVKLYNDQIAYLLSTLSGEEYETIEMDLNITKEIKKNLEDFTKAKIKANIVDKVEIPDRSKYKNITLCFSGGFDSLACMYILPKGTKLTAIDFGEWFEREKEFFKRFKPKTVSTNIRRSNIRLDKNSWTFMGCSTIIYCDLLKTKYNVFGTALEDPGIQLAKDSYTYNTKETAPFKYLGFRDIKLVNGLTAVGTAMMLLKYGRSYLNDSLVASSAPHDEKRYRKQTILDILCKKQGLDLEYEHVEPLKEKVPFGKRSIYVDFILPYIIKNAGLEYAENLVDKVPKEIKEFAKTMRLDFYERLNTSYLTGPSFPNTEIKELFMKKTIESGILPYNEIDFEEFRIISDYVRKNYFK